MLNYLSVLGDYVVYAMRYFSMQYYQNNFCIFSTKYIFLDFVSYICI